MIEITSAGGEKIPQSGGMMKPIVRKIVGKTLLLLSLFFLTYSRTTFGVAVGEVGPGDRCALVFEHLSRPEMALCEGDALPCLPVEIQLEVIEDEGPTPFCRLRTLQPIPPLAQLRGRGAVSGFFTDEANPNEEREEFIGGSLINGDGDYIFQVDILHLREDFLKFEYFTVSELDEEDDLVLYKRLVFQTIHYNGALAENLPPDVDFQAPPLANLPQVVANPISPSGCSLLSNGGSSTPLWYSLGILSLLLPLFPIRKKWKRSEKP